MEMVEIIEYKKVYAYDMDGCFEIVVTLDNTDKSPSGAWNIPARCTEVEPLEEKEGFRVKFNGSAWEYEEVPKEQLKPPEPTLDELKTVKKAKLKSERDRLEVKPITYNGNLFDYDEKARERINAAIIALEVQGSSSTIDWTLADNTSVKVNEQDLKMVVASVAARSNKLHIAYRSASDKVDQAQSKEDLELIVLEY